MLLVLQILSPLMMLAIPLTLGAWVVRRWKLDWAIFGLGGLTFVASQLFHIPFNRIVLNPWVERQGWLGAEGWPWVMLALVFGLSAGVFEELARYLVMKRSLRRVRSWGGGLLFGLGHGGTEAIILGIFALYAFFQALALQGGPLEQLVPADQLESARVQLESYWGMAWYEPLWATLERVSAIAFHSMASLMVLIAVRRRRVVWLAGAIMLHMLFNAVALVSVKALGIAPTELMLAVFGLVFVWVAAQLRPQLAGEAVAQAAETEARPPLPTSTKAEIIDVEQLDGSRFL